MVQGLFKGWVYFIQLEPDNQHGNIQGREEFKEIQYLRYSPLNPVFCALYHFCSSYTSARLKFIVPMATIWICLALLYSKEFSLVLEVAIQAFRRSFHGSKCQHSSKTHQGNTGWVWQSRQLAALADYWTLIDYFENRDCLCLYPNS